MKISKFLLLVVIAIGFSASVHAQKTKTKVKTKRANIAMAYQCPMKCGGEKTYAKNGKCPVCGMQMKPGKAIISTTKFQCPMKCEGDKTYTKSGTCPVCNMNLKELPANKKEDGHEGHNH